MAVYSSAVVACENSSMAHEALSPNQSRGVYGGSRSKQLRTPSNLNARAVAFAPDGLQLAVAQRCHPILLPDIPLRSWPHCRRRPGRQLLRAASGIRARRPFAAHRPWPARASRPSQRGRGADADAADAHLPRPRMYQLYGTQDALGSARMPRGASSCQCPGTPWPERTVAESADTLSLASFLMSDLGHLPSADTLECQWKGSKLSSHPAES
jgi:hypothetical protein